MALNQCGSRRGEAAYRKYKTASAHDALARHRGGAIFA
jgi:hypothetical protein